MKRLVLGSLLMVSIAALAGENTLSPADPPVRLVRARKVQSTKSDEVTGQFMAAKTLPLGFEVGGRISKVNVKKGEVVKTGRLLGSLDPEIIDAQISQAEAGVAAAEAGAELALDVSGRTQKLSTEGSVSDVQNKSAAVTAKQAASQVLMAKAQLAQAKAGRKRHDLFAPFNGTIVDAPDQAGMLIGPGMPQFILMQLDTLTLKATISETARGVVKPGLKVKVTSVSTGVSTDDAVVRVVLPAADPQSRRVPVEIEVPNLDGRFTAMTLGKAVLPLGDARSAVVIPATALGTAGGDHVFVIARDGTLKRLPVSVVERSGKDVTIVAPEPVEQLVDYPTSTLVEGTKVSSAR